MTRKNALLVKSKSSILDSPAGHYCVSITKIWLIYAVLCGIGTKNKTPDCIKSRVLVWLRGLTIPVKSWVFMTHASMKGNFSELYVIFKPFDFMYASAVARCSSVNFSNTEQ